MTDIDFDALRGTTGGDPPDGIYSARLQRAAIVETRNGTKLVSEWQVTDPGPYYWSVWHGFAGQAMSFTQDYLDGLGVDRSKLTDEDAFETELSRVIGREFEVRTEAGAAWINTFIEGPATGTGQTSLDDVPVDTSDLPPAGVGANGDPRDPDDDDIPF